MKPAIHLMNPVFMAEFKGLPSSVKDTFLAISKSFDPNTKIFISSILSSHNGMKRTPSNGPNHAQHRAIDFVPTPFSHPTFLDQESKPRSPQFHWNVDLRNHLIRLFKRGVIKAAVLIEPDHIHIDSNHVPGIYLYLGGKGCYENSPGRSTGNLCLIK